MERYGDILRSRLENSERPRPGYRKIEKAWLRVEKNLRQEFDGPILMPATPFQIRESIARNAQKLDGLVQLRGGVVEKSSQFNEFWHKYSEICGNHAGNGFFLCFVGALAAASPHEEGYPDPNFLYQKQQAAYREKRAIYPTDTLVEELVSDRLLELYSIRKPEEMEELTRAVFDVGGVLIVRQRVEFPKFGVDEKTGEPQSFGHFIGIRKHDWNSSLLIICGDLSPYGVNKPHAKIPAENFLKKPHLDMPSSKKSVIADCGDANVYVYFPSKYEPRLNRVNCLASHIEYLRGF